MSKYAHENRNNVPYGWAIYKVLQGKILYSGWSTSVGDPYPAFEGELIIVNDTTLFNAHLDKKYSFKRFSPKPDSTNSFIAN